jgi:SRSO17 transposase
VFRVFKPKGTLKEGDVYKTKIEIVSEILTELVELGFQIELVLADSLYGESSSFISTLDISKIETGRDSKMVKLDFTPMRDE